jgi:ABC-type nitrate/sulfonate/bicarbonate transport system permease component
MTTQPAGEMPAPANTAAAAPPQSSSWPPLRRLAALLSGRAAGVLLILAILAAWELAAAGPAQSPSFPRMSTVMESWYKVLANGDLPTAVLQTLQRMLIGYAAAAVVGVIVGLLMGKFRFVNNLLEPLIELLRPIPSPAYVPIAILFLGIGSSMKVVLIFVATLFPIIINTYAGVTGVNAALIDTGRTFGLSQMKSIRQIVIPAAAPLIFAGLRISLAISLILAVISEMVAGNDGAGYFILYNQQSFRIPEMYAGILSLGVVGYLLNRVFLAVEKRAIGWHVQSRGGSR